MSRTVLFALLVLGAASRAPGEERDSVGGQCAINAIFGKFATGGYLSATGFAFDSSHGAPVRKVQLMLDGGIPGEVSLRGLRPDVLAHFARQDYLWSGWNGEVTLEGVQPGEHSVEIVAIDHQGRSIPCGRRTFSVIAAPEVPSRRPPVIAAEILLRTALFLAWLAFVGSAAAVLLKAPPATAPFLGLALFGILAEAGGALHVKPSVSALGLTVLGVAFFAWLAWKWRIRIRLPSRESLIVLAISAFFAIVAVIPLASHGEGAVLGDIDDASRECVVADSYSRFGWSVPADVRGHLASVRSAVEGAHVRPGGIYLLSALADAFRTRTHEVHSVAMLGTACLIVWGVGFLARTLAIGRERARLSWLAAAFVTLNSLLLATLYGQHLGSLLGVALFLPFVGFCSRVVRLHGFGHVLAVALLVSAGLVFYPEALPLWGVAALLTLGMIRGAARLRRAMARLTVALLLVIAINPFGLVRFFRFSREWSQKLSSPYERILTGDTHYFPSLAVIGGIEAYREDAPAPVGAVRRLLIPVGGGFILVAGVMGWSRLKRREKAAVVLLLVPIGLGLLANRRLSFPYGYAKLLPMAAAVWAVAFAVLVTALLARNGGSVSSRMRRVLATVSILMTVSLALPSLRHVLQRAVRSVPAYDSAYRLLPALARPLGRTAVILVEEPIVASREWIRYFLSENLVLDRSSENPAGAGPRFLLVDLRSKPQEASGARVRARSFALLPVTGPGSSVLATPHDSRNGGK